MAPIQNFHHRLDILQPQIYTETKHLSVSFPSFLSSWISYLSYLFFLIDRPWNWQWSAHTSVPHPAEPGHRYWSRIYHLPRRNWCYSKQGEERFLFKIVVNFVFCLLNLSYRWICCAGCLCCHGGPFAVFSDGSFLLDARRGNLPLLVCCQGLQHRWQNAGISSDFLG